MTMFKTRITEMLGIQYPILCGGMQWISRAEFVASVCNAGGIGFITAESFETPEDLRTEIKKMHDLTDKPFGVNISMVPEFGLPERSLQFCDVVAEEGVKVVETAGRSPKPLMPKLKDAGITVIHKMTSIRHAESAQKLGVDAITLIGYGSGGHIGMDNVASFILIPMAVSRLDIPVIAGGGVADGKGFLGALAMGAEAVLMGTAFFATQECPAHDAIKERLVQTRENETCLLLNSLHNPIRCVRNKLADECLLLEEENASFEEIISAVAGGKGKLAYDSGDTDISPIACGQIVGAIDEVKTVKKLIDDMVDEAGTLMKRLNAMAT
jgi:NAD(P)H-dependent flavin oxidoreductase YrpB (nitropropane dioxygenase family)